MIVGVVINEMPVDSIEYCASIAELADPQP
jgi:hypothetical protein